MSHPRHGHGHGHSAAGAHRGRLLTVFLLTLAVAAVEVTGGLLSGSLALLADAAHMLADVAGIGMSLLAVWFAARPATPEKTYGWYRLEILAAVVNALILFGTAGFVLLEAWRRLRHPTEVTDGLMLVVALVGMAANLVGLRLLHPAQGVSLNLRGAYLEVLGDLLGSVAVIVAAVVIRLTGFTVADPVASALIALLILPRTWSLLREAVDVLLEATPKGVDMDQVRRHILETPGVVGCHDLHAWAVTSGMHVLSAHVVVEEGVEFGPVLDQLDRCLGDHFDIEHSTFQLEPVGHADHEGARHH